MGNEVMGVLARLDALRPHPRNYNRHSEAQIGRLAESLRRFGQPKEIVVWAPRGFDTAQTPTQPAEGGRGFDTAQTPTQPAEGGRGFDTAQTPTQPAEGGTWRYVIAGHGLVEAARRLGWATLRASDMSETWTEEQALAYMAADNELARLADPDEAALAQLVADLGDVDAQLAALAAGTEKRLAELLAQLKRSQAGEDPGPQIDKAEELRAKWGVELGQLWQLGEHRLICGDCTDRAVVERVMGGERAGMVFTDPPYATFGSSTGKMELGDFNMLKPFWQRLVETIHENTQDGRGAFICCDWRSYPSLFEVVGRMMKPANLIVWNHKAIKLGAQFRPAYELLLYVINHSFKRGWKDQEGNWKIKDRSISDVWEIAQAEAAPGSGREHSSQKPVALVEFAMTHCSDPGDIVTDYFLGSGTMLIACERLGRRCRAVEIEPGYVAVALERWHVMTGRMPVLVE